MTVVARAPRTAGSAAKVFSLADVATKSKPVPNRWALHANQGFGKTSLLAYAVAPVFLMTRGETGLLTLIESGQLPETPHLPELEGWTDLLAAVRFLRTGEHSFKTLVLDTANGAERLLHEFICQRDFEGDWGEKGFGGYGRGYDVSLAEWRMFQNELDKLRTERGMTIFFLLHSRVKTFKNPSGPDYDRYTPEMHEKTWTLTKGWLDCILFGNFEVTVKQQGNKQDALKKGKAAETSQRVIYTNSDAPIYDAKNRLGLPAEIEMGDNPAEGWRNLATALRSSRKTTEPAAPETGASNE